MKTIRKATPFIDIQTKRLYLSNAQFLALHELKFDCKALDGSEVFEQLDCSTASEIIKEGLDQLDIIEISWRDAMPFVQTKLNNADKQFYIFKEVQQGDAEPIYYLVYTAGYNYARYTLCLKNFSYESE